MIEQLPDGRWRVVLPAPDEEGTYVWRCELEEGEGGALIIIAKCDRQALSA